MPNTNYKMTACSSLNVRHINVTGIYDQPIGGIKQCCDPSVCPSVCLYHASSSKRCTLGLSLLQNTDEKLHAEVQPSRQRGPEVAVTERGLSFRRYRGDILFQAASLFKASDAACRPACIVTVVAWPALPFLGHERKLC